MITREYALFCCGRYVSQSVGEYTFYGQGNMVYGKAMEAAKSNALVRCWKDLGIASELWDPKVVLCYFLLKTILDKFLLNFFSSKFVLDWKEKFATSVWCEHSITAEKRKLWHRSDREPAKIFSYPWKLMASSSRWHHILECKSDAIYRIARVTSFIVCQEWQYSILKAHSHSMSGASKSLHN